MPEYGGAVDDKRKPTEKKGVRYPAKENLRVQLESWVKRKGIVGRSDLYKDLKDRKVKTRDGKILSGSAKVNRVAKQLAFLMARKIHRDGFTGNQFYTEVINDGRLDKLRSDLTEFYKKEVIIDIQI